jgi:hypothetical protein
LVEYAQLFRCNFGTANSYKELKDYTNALLYYELASQQSYTSEDSIAVEQKISKMKQIIVLLGRLDAALDAFHKKVDEKYQ